MIDFDFKERDFLAAKYLLESDTNGIDQSNLKKWFYSKMSPGGFRNKLKRWRDNNLIKKSEVIPNVLVPQRGLINYLKDNRERFLSICENNHMRLVPLEKYSSKKRVDTRNYRHDRKLNQLRYKLNQPWIKISNWTTSKMIYALNEFEKRLPDASFELNGNRYALELEFSMKVKSKYKEIIDNYSEYELIDHYDRVLYIISDDIFDNLKQLFTTGYEVYNRSENKSEKKQIVPHYTDMNNQLFLARLSRIHRKKVSIYPLSDFRSK